MIRRIITLSAALAVAVVAQAQNAPSRQRAQALVTSAMSSAAAGDTNTALRLLKEATKTDDKFALAHFEYGVMLSRTSKMGLLDTKQRHDATVSLERALELEDNPWAFFELGKLKLKTPLLRLAAQSLFERAMESAERNHDLDAEAEIAFEIGQIYDRQYRTMADRVMMVGDQKILDPDWALYEKGWIEDFMKNSTIPVPDAGELDARTAEEWYTKALKARPGHEGTVAAYSVILYDHSRFDEMAHIARAAAAVSPSSARVHLVEGLALLRLGQFGPANAALERGVSLMTDRERKYVASLDYVMRKGEAIRYDSLDAASRATFDTLYWKTADPLYLTDLNEQRLAFLGRVAYADLHFTDIETGVRGALTDRGQIVLRYGEPPVRATIAPDVQFKNQGESMAAVTTVWIYPTEQLHFVFVGPPGMNAAIFAGDFHNYAADVREMVPVHYEKLVDNLTIDSIPLQIARFRGNNPANTRVEVYAAVPAGKLASAAQVKTAPVVTGFIIADQRMNRVLDARDTLKASADDTTPRTTSWSKQFVPGDYEYSVEALEPQTNRSARARGGLTLGAFPAKEFALSDVLVGKNLESSTEIRTRSDLHMDVAPAGEFTVGQPLGLFWEIYGARPTKDGAVHLKVEVTLTVLSLDRLPQIHAKVFGAIADKLGTSAVGEHKAAVSYEFSVPAPSAADDRILHAVNVELADAPPAEYLIEIKTTDLESGQAARTARVVHVRRP